MLFVSQNVFYTDIDSKCSDDCQEKERKRYKRRLNPKILEEITIDD